MSFDRRLWEKLSGIKFDDIDAVFPFTSRLARDNRWTRDYARRVTEEYRRFAYLAATAGHEVTPSDEVDQAWHLHLTYTRHYWGAFAEALGKPLHHGPTKGGPQEDRRYRENYAATLKSYEAAFGETAPQDIWPPAEIRFGAAPFMARINTKEHFVISRKKIWAAGAGITALGGAAMFAASAAAAQAAERQSVIEKLREIPPAFWLMGVVVIVIIFLLAARAGKGGKSSSASGGYAAGAPSGKGDGGGSDGGGSGCGGAGCGGGGCGGG